MRILGDGRIGTSSTIKYCQSSMKHYLYSWSTCTISRTLESELHRQSRQTKLTLSLVIRELDRRRRQKKAIVTITIRIEAFTRRIKRLKEVQMCREKITGFRLERTCTMSQMISSF